MGAQVGEEAKSTSRSAISRRFVRQTETALAELMSRDLSELDIKVLMLDGEHLAERCVVVALAITADGTKVPVGLWDGSTENKTVVRSLLADLVERGLAVDDGLLVVLDGAKALSAAVREVFGAKALIQRCTLHKRRNLADHLPDKEQAWVDAKLVKAFAHPDPDAGLRNAKHLAAQLDKNYPSAAASLREGLEEMFTVARLGIDGRLAKTLTTSNPVESMISIARTTNRNVTRWRDGQMVLRWTAAGMLNAERSFRRIKGHKQMPQLVTALHRHAHPETAKDTDTCRCRRLEFTMDRHPNSTRLGTCSRTTRSKVPSSDGYPRGGSRVVERWREMRAQQHSASGITDHKWSTLSMNFRVSYCAAEAALAATCLGGPRVLSGLCSHRQRRWWPRQMWPCMVGRMGVVHLARGSPITGYVVHARASARPASVDQGEKFASCRASAASRPFSRTIPPILVRRSLRSSRSLGGA